MAYTFWKYLVAILTAVVLVLAITLPLTLILTRRPAVKGNCYAKAAVAADAGTCSEIGRDILKRKGSAVDAAIATLLCVGLFNPHSMGIGGGVIFTIYDPARGKVETIAARETAPMGISKDMFDSDTQKTKPGLFIAVPGELRGYKKAHDRHGRLNWKELFEPSIKLAFEGFKIGRALAKAINMTNNTIHDDPTLCEVFCDSNNKSLKENDTIRFLQLAATYCKIAEKGADDFYNGSLAQDIVDDIKAAGGIITHEDLKHYKPEVKEYALNFTVGKYTVHVPDAPFGGPLLALILNVLKGYNISSSSVSTTENKILTYHRMIEAFRFASAQKSNLGDPLYENITELIQNMTSDSFADDIRRKINDSTTKNETDYKDNSQNLSTDFGTSHLSVIAEDGSAVAVTSSLNNYFGSKVMSRRTGIIFNDQLRDFSDPELKDRLTRQNLLSSGKRSLSSMSPTIILDNDSKQVKMVVGAAGGPNITTSITQVIMNYLFFDYDLQKAVNEPRVHSQLNASKTFVEQNFDESVIAGLKLKNHEILENALLSVVQAVVRQENKVCAASDPRKGGYPAGY